MPHESNWLERFERMVRGQALQQHAACAVRWSKLNVDAHRGTPDVHLFIGCHGLKRPGYDLGPAAWLEAKRGNKWPDKMQAIRLSHLGQLGEPAYLLRMLNPKVCELYTVDRAQARNLFEMDKPYRKMYVLELKSDWDMVAARLIRMVAFEERS